MNFILARYGNAIGLVLASISAWAVAALIFLRLWGLLVIVLLVTSACVLEPYGGGYGGGYDHGGYGGGYGHGGGWGGGYAGGYRR